MSALSGGNRNLLPDFRIDHDRDRSVVDQAHLHIRTKLAAGDGTAEGFGQLFEKRFVERLGHIGFAGVVKRRPRAFSRTREKRELADGQNLSGNIANRAIHLTLVIREDTHSREFRGHPRPIISRIRLRNTDQNEQATVDLAHDLASDRDAGRGNTLKNDAHVVRSKHRKVRFDLGFVIDSAHTESE